MPAGQFQKYVEANPGDDPLFPLAHLVPKDPAENDRWRKWVEALGEFEGEREFILDCCRRDVLFFINGFLCIKQESPVPADLPFILWPKQEEYIRLSAKLRRRVESDPVGKERADIVSEKPREVGWTWLNLAEGLHIILFTFGATGLVGSRVEYDVDKRGQSKTLFWKLDYFLEHLPRWFLPEKYWSPTKGYPEPNNRFRSSMRMSIPGAGTMLGSATHENFGRSGRYAWMLLDELAHVDRGQYGMGDRIWAGTTNTCRVRRAVSTPNGRLNKFSRLRHDGGVPVFSVHWYDDPLKMVGAYRLTESMQVGSVELKEGDWWSPWAEETRKAFGNDKLFSQEILLSYEGLGGGFYDHLLSKIKHDQVKPPVWRGGLLISNKGQGPRVEKFIEKEPVFLELWELPGFSARWKDGVYILGCDVAAGSRDLEGRGASNSVIAVGRLEGRKVTKVAQYMTHGLMPHRFARIICALGWCFRQNETTPAHVIWENDGAGDIAGQTLKDEYGYPRLHWEPNQAGNAATFGFLMKSYRLGDGRLAGSRVNVFNEHLRWLDTGEYEESSYRTYHEMECYKTDPDGGAFHVQSKASLDPGEARKNHGDSVIATVLMLWKARQLRDLAEESVEEKEPPVTSVAWAQKRRRQEASALWR